MNYVSAEEAVKAIKSYDKIFVHGVACTPTVLLDALTKRHKELKDVELYNVFTLGSADYAKPEYQDSFITNSIFIQGNLRPYVNQTRTQYIPTFLGQYHLLFDLNKIPLDYAFIQVSPPGEHGHCSLGLAVDVTKAAIRRAKKVIALVNPNMPRTFGDSTIDESEIDIAVWNDNPIVEISAPEISSEEELIGRHIAEIVDDGATLQIGIGGIPNAVLACLNNHKNLGIHTEMFSDGIIPLVESGVIDGSQKVERPGKIVSTFTMGTKKLYDFINNNSVIELWESSYTNNPAVIRNNPKTTAINSAIEVDITGQVCADSIGTRIYSGVGGQMDFVYGASLSPGGKPIIALTSTTNKGVSKISQALKLGAGVVTTRANVHYIVTEYGWVDLFGKTLKQRAKELISIAHPDFREELEKAAFEMFK